MQQRKVLLYKVISGGPDQVVGRDTSSNKGAWDIDAAGLGRDLAGPLLRQGQKLSQGTAGTIYVCQAGRSKTIKVSN